MPKTAKIAAIIILSIMFVLLISSSWNDSLTMDELAHTSAGYSYLSQRDYRINPEHPPLIKDLAALPLLFLNLNFPSQSQAWQKDVNGQWDLGRIFMYESGNNADKIIHWSRLPIMLLAILFGWLFFKWASGIYGYKTGLLALFFFAFSPTFLAHSRYVTTDLAASFGFFIGLATFLNFLKNQNRKNLIIAGLVFGIAQLLKFSLVLLAPIYIILGLLFVFLENYKNWKWKKFIKDEFLMIGKIALIGALGLIVIWALYLFHVWQYPIERQVQDTTFILGSFGMKPLSGLAIWLAGEPILRALGQYLLGLLMVVQRSSGGNTASFMGEISSVGWTSYFPILYLLKEQLAFHIFTLIALILGIKNIFKSREKTLGKLIEWLRKNFVVVASFVFIAIYWFQAISSPLNIGLRHILPTFPFIYLLVAKQIAVWTKNKSAEIPSSFWGWLKTLSGLFVKKAAKTAIVIALALWMVISVFANFPYFLSYFNALSGGTENGYKIATDSNYDWGQDLKRLKNFTVQNNINTIAVDYFGGGNPQYYFGGGFIPWQSSKGSPANTVEWLAVSATFLESAQATPVKNFQKNPNDSYSFLKNKTPVARAGTSIFIYKF
ncbi:MAG: glycosyltransferase family 39 protein [bacterium]|nr:glycosyltransferase family 39 protein [bacterium]